MATRAEVKKIALLGAESTGKSTLARALAERLGGLWVPEYLRTFCNEHGRTPTRPEQQDIARGQVGLETAAVTDAVREGRAWVFCDTTPFMTAVYSEYVFGDTNLYELAVQHQRSYGATLLLATDVGWQADGLQRESPAIQALIDRLLRERLSEHEIATMNVSGQSEARVECALAQLNLLREP